MPNREEGEREGLGRVSGVLSGLIPIGVTEAHTRVLQGHQVSEVQLEVRGLENGNYDNALYRDYKENTGIRMG